MSKFVAYKHFLQYLSFSEAFYITFTNHLLSLRSLSNYSASLCDSTQADNNILEVTTVHKSMMGQRA